MRSRVVLSVRKECAELIFLFFLCLQAALTTEADATTEVLRAQLVEAQTKLEATAKVSGGVVACSMCACLPLKIVEHSLVTRPAWTNSWICQMCMSFPPELDRKSMP